jgi:preprotein translocase subunit YajC
MIGTVALFFAQATNVAPAAVPDSSSGGGGMGMFLIYPVLFLLIYFAFIRPQSQARKRQEELVKSVKTGDKVVTTGGIHGVISNVKDTTVLVKVADNVKLEIEKSQLDKIIRADAVEPAKPLATKS